MMERLLTALPSAWIDRLFERLAVAYGTEKFTAIWRGQDIDRVKAVWAAELGKFTAAELRAALVALPNKHPSWPPTLYEFVELCPRLPKTTQQLPAPREVGERPELKRITGEVGKVARHDPRAWADWILERKAAGDKAITDYAWRMALAAKDVR